MYHTDNRKAISYALKSLGLGLEEIEHELVETTAQLVSAGLQVSERAAMGVRIKQLADEKAEVELAIQQLEYEYATAKQEYEEYRIRVALRRGG